VAVTFRSRQWVARPRNLAAAGIHDDETARRLGFAGGFVPGVGLYEHIVAEMLDQGVDWLREGSACFQFRRPVYSGEETRFGIDAQARTFTLRAMSEDAPRALGSLGIDAPAPSIPHGVPAPLPERKVPLGDPAQVGVLLRHERTIDTASLDAFAAITGFPRDGGGGRRVVPSGQWSNPIRLLGAYFDCPTTIHFQGSIWHHGPLYDGELLVTRGVITAFYERGGNQVVHFQVVEETADGRPVATIDHHSVYQLARAKG
jgi:hypothetical protein